jgi:hypothetical protein
LRVVKTGVAIRAVVAFKASISKLPAVFGYKFSLIRRVAVYACGIYVCRAAPLVAGIAANGIIIKILGVFLQAKS